MTFCDVESKNENYLTEFYTKKISLETDHELNSFTVLLLAKQAPPKLARN